MSVASSKAAPAKHGALPWRPVTATVIAILLFVVGQIVGGLVVSWLGTLAGKPDSWLADSVDAQFSYTLLAETIIIGGLVLFMRSRKTSLRVLGWAKPKVVDAAYALAGFAIYFILYFILLQVVSNTVSGFNPDQEQAIGFANVSGVLPLLLVFISLVILPPLTEELLMRGFIYTSWRRAHGVITATIVTSILFAAAHLPGGNPGAGPLWVAALDTLVLSLVLCRLREKTGRLWAGIGVHALKNGLAFVLLFVIGTH